MAGSGAVLVVGGSSGLGLDVARHYADAGEQVYLTSRDLDRAQAAADEVGGNTTGLSLDLAHPESIGDSVADLGPIKYLVITAVLRDENTAKDFKIEGATALVTMKLIGPLELFRVLGDRLGEGSSAVIFGGLAKERPYPGSTTITTVNGGVSTMIRSLAIELSPVRVNSIHPAVVGDSWYWADKPAAMLEGLKARTASGRLITTSDVVGATVFLLENPGMNAHNLNIDGGWLVT